LYRFVLARTPRAFSIERSSNSRRDVETLALEVSNTFRAILICLVMAASASARSGDNRKVLQKALGDAFANLDQVTGDHWDDPVSSRWEAVGDVMALSPIKGNSPRLVAWINERSFKALFGLADGSLEGPCDDAGKQDSYKVGGVWLSFKVACMERMRVLTPKSVAAKNGMEAAVRKNRRLTIESSRGQKYEFDLQGVPVADAVLRVKAAGAAAPVNPKVPGYFPGVL
jgi:hypothetical protein